jgi:hypothetical protein
LIEETIESVGAALIARQLTDGAPNHPGLNCTRRPSLFLIWVIILSIISLFNIASTFGDSPHAVLHDPDSNMTSAICLDNSLIALMFSKYIVHILFKLLNFY